MHRALRDPPDSKQPVVIPTRRRRQDIDLARRKPHGGCFFPEFEPSGLTEFVKVIQSFTARHEDKMLSIPGPLSMSLIGILRPFQRKPMGIAAIGVQFQYEPMTGWFAPCPTRF